MKIVWIYVEGRQFPYCVLRSAIQGGRIITLCLEGDGFPDAMSYQPVLITTVDPGKLACPACRRHLAVTTRGAAVAVEPEDYEEQGSPRRTCAGRRRWMWKQRRIGDEARNWRR